MRTILAFTLASTLMAGCGGSSDSSDQGTNSSGTGSESDSSQGGNDNDSTNPTGEATVLEGTWRKQCGPVAGQEHSDIVTLTFTGNTFTSDIENYLDAGCNVPYAEAPNPTASGTFVLGEDVMLSSGVTATELDSHITQFDGAPFDIDEYNVIYIQGDILYTGEGEADSPQQRPTSLDYNRPFDRVN
ncbi:MAG: hypothetical protein CL581_12330 [Alteromonadaceae bacterium]|nr:hypothetical protein [Alteromonadaceae bacterium]MBH86260.1 hypothetical protein [Alteromonadaceae bacterium]|tara:strand:+ start:20478 stop:21038 length:561 start_codon:yes stop_codon:yes gene_type:complete